MTVLIADDEHLVRYGLRSMLEELNLGLQVVAEAADGEALVALVLKHRPDVAFVDIRMPGLGGLAAIRKARKAGSATRWVILSSHAEFEYASEAIQLGVAAYLLKPAGPAQVADVVRPLAAAVAQDAEDRSAAFEQAVLLALASPAASPPEVLTAWAALVKLDAGAESSPRDRLDFPAGALRLVRSGAADHRRLGLQTAVWTTGGTIAAVAHWDPADPEAQAQAGRWRDSLASLTRISGGLSLRMTALAADGLSGWESLRTALALLAEAMPLRAVVGTGTLHNLESLDRRVTDPAVRDLCLRADLFLDARDRSEFQTLESLAEACIQAAQGPVPSAALEAIGRHLAFRTGLEVPDPAPKGGAWAAWTRGLVDLARSEAPDSRREADIRARVIDRVDQYLRTHLADEVRVPELASSLGLSPNYLSTVYRQFSGVTLSERLASLRLDRARELLAKPGSQVKEVAVAVGYKGARHFARLYHERFGQYPSGRGLPS